MSSNDMSNSSSNTQVNDDNAPASDYDSDTDSSQSLLAHGTDYEQQSLYNGTDIVPHPEPSADRERRKSFIREDEDPLQIDIPVNRKREMAGWGDLPFKSQLAILTVARLAEPLVQTSLRSYVFYQLKSFDETLPDSTIASQAGIMQGCFAAAQLCTAMLWGRASDTGGRKRILLIGLAGTTISCIGFGLATTFWQALLFRMMAGALNGNVGVMRTMISEIVREKRFQSRAFLLLPMCSNVGSIIGPILGGFLSDPAKNYSSVFGKVEWLKRHPYAAPNFVSAFFLVCAWFWVFFGLDETHENFCHQTDYGREVTQRLFLVINRFRRTRPTSSGDHSLIDDEEEPLLPPTKPPKRVAPRYKNKLPFRSIFTYNVVCTLIAHGLLTGSNGTFNNMWSSFLATTVNNPIYDPIHNPHPDTPFDPHHLFKFRGGLGMTPIELGLVMSILGAIGITLQLLVYPIVNARIGTVRSWRIFLYCFPIVYICVPFLSLIPSTSPPPHSKTGKLIWGIMPSLLLIQVIGKTFAGPATTILINNCSPHPTVLGTIHGIGQTASSGAKTLGPAIGGWLLGYGNDHGYIGLSFWVLAVVAMGSCVASNWVREGDGHEIRLEGDDEAEEEAEATNRAMGFN